MSNQFLVTKARDVIPDFGEAIKARMAQLGFDTNEKLVQATGLSREQIRKLRMGHRPKGGRYTTATTGPVCRALRWTPNSIERLERGDPPIPLEDQVEDDALSALRSEVAELRELILRWIPPPDTTPGDQ